jgi:hypothetical protein
MNIKDAILAKGEIAHKGYAQIIGSGIDNRAPKINYKNAYTDEQISFLFKNGLLTKYNKVGAFWEEPNVEYWEFTEKGISCRAKYTGTYWEYFYYYIFPIWKIKYWWQNLRIKFGHHYDWQDYTNDNFDYDTL